MFTYLHTHRRRILALAVAFVCLAGALVFVKNNYFLYKSTIVHVTAVSETVVGSGEMGAPSYTQRVTARVMNGPDRGRAVSFTNQRTYAGIFDYNITVGDDVFVNFNSDFSAASVTGFKRDFYLALLLAVFVFLLILVASKKSLMILLSLAANMLIFAAAIFLNLRSVNLLALFSAATVLFTCGTLLIISGFNKKTYGAIIATLCSVAVMMGIAALTFAVFRNSIHWETANFLEYIKNSDNVFYSGVMISGLGAIMDIAIIMSAAINELLAKTPDIGAKALRRSAWAIAQDITGTMLNVLLFAGVIGALPVVILVISNGSSLPFAFQYYGPAEIIRALVGCIGIVLAVPISYAVNLALRGRLRT